MPKQTPAELDSDDIDWVYDLFLNASREMVYSPDSTISERLAALKERVLSDLSFREETNLKAATDFTLSEAIKTFGLKYVESLVEFRRNHSWDIEKDMGREEFQTTPGFGEKLF